MARKKQKKKRGRAHKPRKPTARTFDTRRARLLARYGHGPTEIAHRIGAHPEAVRRFLIKVGLRTERTGNRKLTDEQLLAELRRGLDAREAARKRGAAEINAHHHACRVMRERKIREIDSARLRKMRKHPEQAFGTDHNTCLVCGGKVKSLITHLAAHGLSLAAYRRRYGLGPDEPPVLLFNKPWMDQTPKTCRIPGCERRAYSRDGLCKNHDRAERRRRRREENR